MITGTTRDYTFRQVDLSIFPDLSSPEVPVSARIGPRPAVSTGHSKAAQGFLKALMTPLGHYKSSPSYGSNFTDLVYSGATVYPEQLPNIFAMEALRVIEWIYATRSQSSPDDEVIERADLISYSVTPGKVDLMIELIYRNEETPRTIVLPITLGPS